MYRKASVDGPWNPSSLRMVCGPAKAWTLAPLANTPMCTSAMFRSH